jgi:phospholipid/cholesterol/gamma-HCH transport system substrate-binding protein
MARHRPVAVAASVGVVALAAGFLAYGRLQIGSAGGETYELVGEFLSSDGLHAGADVVIGGVAVGRVNAVELDTQRMTSRVVFSVRDDLKLPRDSSLSIGSTSLASAAALLIEPGHESNVLAPHAVIQDTRPLVTLEQQVSQYIFGGGGVPPAGQ